MRQAMTDAATPVKITWLGRYLHQCSRQCSGTLAKQAGLAFWCFSPTPATVGTLLQHQHDAAEQTMMLMQLQYNTPQHHWRFASSRDVAPQGPAALQVAYLQAGVASGSWRLQPCPPEVAAWAAAVGAQNTQLVEL
jgi:hypothetical protein